MKHRAFVLALLLPVLAAGAESLVPRETWIDDRAARLELAAVLRADARLAEAERALAPLLSANPNDREARLLLADLLATRGDAPASRREFERALAGVPPGDPRWLLFAARMNEWGDFHRAERIVRAAPRSREQQRLLAATLAGGQQFEEAAVIYEELLRKNPRDAASRRDLAGLWAAANETPRSPSGPAESLADVERQLTRDPDNFPLAVRRAELLAAEARFDEALAALDDLDDLDARLPGTAKVALTRARALSWARRYDESLAAYDAIIAAHPTDPIARLEKARVAAWGKRMALAQRTYRELAAVATAPRRREAVALEAAAKKHAWRRHFLRASRSLHALTALQRGNQEAWFDRAQADHALGLTDRSAQAYDTLLTLDPTHRQAREGLTQLAINQRPAAMASYWYWDEKGSGRLSDITRQRIRAGGEVPVRSRYAVRGFAETWIEQPDDGVEAFVAQGFALEGGGTLNEWLRFDARYAFKAYLDPDLAPTNTGGASVTANLDDYALLTLGYAREDEIHNRFSLFQGTQADNFAVGAQSFLNRRVEVNARFVLRRYTDDNWQTDARLDLGLLLIDHPHSLKLVLTGVSLNTQRQNIFLTDASGQTTDVIHPYWTPRGYFRGVIGLEWRHDLARDFFAGAPRHYYGAVVRVSTDTDSNESLAVQGEYLIDLARRWTFQAAGGVERSAQWNGASALVSLSYRF